MRCLECDRPYWMPPSKAEMYVRCSAECNAKFRQSLKMDRKRSCKTCDKEFFPRRTQLSAGIGLFCSQKCSVVPRIEEIRKMSKEIAQSNWSSGKFKKSPKGEKNKLWTGGPKAAMARRIASGKAAEALKIYRAQNPERVKEWSHNRRHRKIGKLPRGTVSGLMEAQKGRCVYCRIDIRKSYHVDHIQPLSGGGKHERENIQLLCPTCNVRKSAKDPIQFAQEKGLLL